MALQLEEQVMQEVGFGQNYRWYNGSGSCRGIRQKAVEVLPERINQYHSQDDSAIAPAYAPLMETLKTIATAESGAVSEFDWKVHALKEFQDRCKAIGKEAAVKEREEREKTAWKPQGYWPSRQDSVLTNTWQAVSYVIAEHIHTASLPEEERQKKLDELNQWLKLEYVTKERLFGRLAYAVGESRDAYKMQRLGDYLKHSAKTEGQIKRALKKLGFGGSKRKGMGKMMHPDFMFEFGFA